MQIWVDADACPVVVREIVCRAAERTSTTATFVANQPVRLPRSPWLKSVQVSQGFDVADDAIVARCEPGDLVITADIPLASEVIAKGALALNPRGELYTKESIGQRLNMRDFMDTLRASGIDTGGAPKMSQSERRDFANNLDRLLAKKA
ncbi:YaiI/YqxD family protein [Granulosicoccaceae sp. 1_MG-2023]|nr:YaiI/YqxD family protein [Granulosicoccaceae sp. 1_MG-2023]